MRSTSAVCIALTAALAAAVPVAGALAEQEVRFASGGVDLAGTLTVPDGPGPHPAIVFLHGSGPMSREGAASYAAGDAELGLASLRFDKRGTGESGGSWLEASLTDLAADGYHETIDSWLLEKIVRRSTSEAPPPTAESSGWSGVPSAMQSARRGGACPRPTGSGGRKGRPYDPPDHAPHPPGTRSLSHPRGGRGTPPPGTLFEELDSSVPKPRLVDA